MTDTKTDPTNSDLVPWGYADGSYMCKCHRCESRFTGDKRCWSCKPCALAAKAEKENESVKTDWDAKALEIEKATPPNGVTDIQDVQRHWRGLIAQGFIAAIAEEREACWVKAAIHSQYPITTSYDKGYAKGREDAAAAIREQSDD